MEYEFVNNGSDLKEMLCRLDLSKAKFAELCGVSRQTIDNICRNKYKFRKSLLITMNYVIKDYIEDNDLVLVTEYHYKRRKDIKKD